MSDIVALLKRCRPFLDPPSGFLKTHKVLQQIDEFLTPSRSETFILNLGSGSTFYGPHIINLDISQMPHVNVIGDAHKLPFRSDSLDAVFCQAVLEHVSQPNVVVTEMHRVLKPGGKVYIDVPFTYPYHAEIDFQRYTPDGLRELFNDFEILDISVSVEAATAMIYQIRWTLAALLSFNNRVLFAAWKVLLGWMLFPLRYLNLPLRNNQFAWQCATGYRLFARKSSDTSPKNAQADEAGWISRYSQTQDDIAILPDEGR